MFGKIGRTIALGAGAAAISLGALAGSAQAADAPTRVGLYDLPGYGGEQVALVGNGAACLHLGSLDNRISSVQLSQPVRVFDGAGCFGESLELRTSVPDLGPFGWDDRISSVLIPA